MRNLFLEVAYLTEEAFETMKNAVVAYVDRDFKLAEEEADKTIAIEKKQDRAKEEFFERIFSRETMVFSRTDRIQIIENIDKITDKIELVVRKLLLYQIEIKGDLTVGIKELAELNKQIGDEVYKMVVSVLDDFKQAKIHITKIANLRRNVREKRWILQKLNYDSYQDDFLAFRFTESLIKYLMEPADRAEIFADRMFILINKYAN